MDLSDSVEVQRIELEKVRLSVSRSLPNEITARLHEMDHLGDMIIAQFQTYIAGMGGEEIRVKEKWPRDWWQAVRERWMPKWWLTRHPIQYKRINIQRRVFAKVCPHVQLPSTYDDHHCIRFLAGIPDWSSNFGRR